ncbi:hypothetical protein G7Y89_g12260 [Cudoniella acicularis]|uniref:Uncharacterized protein n=1 Tax=Cudoniella acicularis TaxID=354080 RepID=A0A8H4VZU3_9HELO|nr:hypothetical protein G7Y89_g12260 [Cudoniella acicularis]
MPSCFPSYRRAVQRQLLLPTETVWISEDVLCQAFNRFVSLSKTSRRYGSFVPGPLEARRRMGKRRMAYASQSTPSSPFALGPIWNLFAETDMTRFQWEPPTPRASDLHAPPDRLQSWLSGLLTAPREEVSVALENSPSIAKSSTQTLKLADVLEFRKDFQLGSEDQKLKLCQYISQKLRANLVLGEVSEVVLRLALGWDLARVMHQGFSDSKLADSQCLSFYQAIWEGILSCKVVRPDELDGDTMNRLLKRLSELRHSPDVQGIACAVLSSASTTQLKKMRPGATCLISSWAQSWMSFQHPVGIQPCSAQVEMNVAHIDSRILELQDLFAAVPNTTLSGERIARIREALHGTQRCIVKSIDVIDGAEDCTSPNSASIRTLAESLSKISRDSGFMSSIIMSCSQQIATKIHSLGKPNAMGRSVKRYNRLGYKRRLHSNWLSLLSQIPHLDPKLFIRAWKLLGISHSPLSQPRTSRRPRTPATDSLLKQSLASNIVLRHWINLEIFECPQLVRNAFELTPKPEQNFASLLFTINKYEKWCSGKIQMLVTILHRLGRFDMVHGILSQMKELGIKLPTRIIADCLEPMSFENVRLAYNIHNLWLPMRSDVKSIRLEFCPNFVLSLIDDPLTPPENIWKLLRIPVYESLPPYLWPGITNNPNERLSPKMVDLITKIAIAFAQSKCRPPRVALRNVYQCLMHLRIYRAPVSPEMTQAISQSGLTREMLRGRFISQGRLEWAFPLIQEVEGTEVAETVDKIIFHHRKLLIENRRLRSKRRRTLKTGLIS